MNTENTREIFFSYGHDMHKEIVKALAEEIEVLSDGKVKAWIDHKSIKQDAHWRTAISEGIDRCDGVLAFLSKYSVRERGVCLDELAIAIASKHGMIRTILLEKHGSFETPTLVKEYQWGDMSDYPDIQAKGDHEFRAYIKEKAQAIIDMVSSEEITKYNEEIQSLREKLGLQEKEEITKFDRMLKEEMIGRKWLKEEVDNWIFDKNAKQIMVIYGEPGAGKSMFSAHLQHYNPNVAAAFPCDIASKIYCTTDDIIKRITYKIALRLPDYRNWLISNFEDEKFNMGSGKDLFNNLIGNPLAHMIDGNRSSMVIIIDAFDEAENDQLAQFIMDCLPLMPDWIKFLITSRKESQIVEMFEEYPNIDIREHETQNAQDICAYYDNKLAAVFEELAEKNQVKFDAAEIEAFKDRLVINSEGVFTYARCVCNNIQEDAKQGKLTLLSKYPLPKGISALFKDTLDRKFKDKDHSLWTERDYIEKWRKPLSMICASEELIPVETLIILMDWNKNDYIMFMNLLAGLLEEEKAVGWEDIHDKVKVFHKSFAEWLHTTQTNYAATASAGLEYLAEACYDVYEMDFEQLDDYIMMNMPRYLKKAKSRKLRKLYLKMLQDEAYRKKLQDKRNDYLVRNWYTTALRYEETTLEITREMVEKNPESAIWKQDLCRSLMVIGIIKGHMLDRREMWEAYEECMEIVRELEEQYPEMILNKKLKADVLYSIYFKKLEEDNKIEALKCLEQCMEIRQELVEKFPEDEELKRDFDWVHRDWISHTIKVEPIDGIDFNLLPWPFQAD